MMTNKLMPHPFGREVTEDHDKRQRLRRDGTKEQQAVVKAAVAYIAANDKMQEDVNPEYDALEVAVRALPEGDE